MSALRSAFDDRPLRSHLERCGFDRENIAPDFRLGDSKLPLLAFSHRPFDTRTACAVAAPAEGDTNVFLRLGRETGAPLAFRGSGQRWSVWQLTHTEPSRLWEPERGSLDAFFRAYRSQLDPRSIYRAKTAARFDAGLQLSFVDAGLLEMVESESGTQLCGLIERMILATREKLHMAAFKDLAEMDAQWLVQDNFRLVAARLLHDKQVQNFKTLDLEDIDNVLARVARHYGSRPQHALSQRRRKALVAAAGILDTHSSLRLVSTETLARVADEVLITKETRKALGTHCTPAWLVNYIVQRLAPWIEEQPASRRLVYEPGCGHAPFLVAMLRLFSGMKPCVTMDDAARHAWLQSRLAGAETDDFAREVARLSLTLADIPNPNGWELDDGNMFADGRMEARLKQADIIVSNPPFETRPSTGDELFHVGQAAELLRRINLHAKPGTLVAYIMPQTILDSKKTTALRRELLGRFEWQEILRLPDKVFDKADVETAVIIGRRLPEKSRASVPVRILHVWEDGLDDFQVTSKAKVQEEVAPSSILAGDEASMLLPDLAPAWAGSRLTLADIAIVGHGLLYISETALDDDECPRFPVGQSQRVEKRTKGYELGYYQIGGSKDLHVPLKMDWMNVNRDAIAAERAGYATGLSQIVMNYVRVRRGPWRIKAYADPVGRRSTSNFLVIRPTSPQWSLHCLWALLNGPVASAYSFAHSTKKHIYSSRLLKMPVPDLDEASAHLIDDLVCQYLAAAARLFPNSDGPVEPPTGGSAVFLPGFEQADPDADAEDLKHALWRIDSAVLRLYNFDPKTERALLEYFTGYQRPGVPFRQNEYYPPGFEGAQTLAELLSITADWEANNTRRLELIDREYEGKLKKAELAELERLQHLAMLRRRLVAPFPFAEIDAEIERLKREGKWTE